MFEMWLDIDKEKIKKEGKYDPLVFESEVKKVVFEAHFEEVSHGYYTLDDETYSDVGALTYLNIVFSRSEVIIPNLKLWKYRCEEDGEVDILEERNKREVTKRGNK